MLYEVKIKDYHLEMQKLSFKEIAQTGWKRASLLALIIFAAYFPVLTSYRTASPDAQLILSIFETTTSIWDYLLKLFTLKTLDFQPLRDLSLSLDWLIFQHLNVNTFILQNCLIWIGICYFINQLLKKLFPMLSDEKVFIFVLLFAVYPLFNSVLSWSMARKHLLAFLFIMLATVKFFEKKNFLMHVYYLLALLSQPIGILWPIWVAAYAWFIKKEKFRSFFSLSLILILIGVVNFIYYKHSDVFTSVFQSKTSDAFEMADKILALGHYFFQLFVPYYQTFFYDLGHWSIWVGFVLAGAFYIIWSCMKLPKKDLMIWSLFALLPVLVVLNTPKTKSDTYLLLPSFGLLVLVIRMFENHLKDKKKYLFLGLLSFWIIFNHLESTLWTDHQKFSLFRNFGRRPTCLSAVMSARSDFALGIIPSGEVIDFLKNNQCLRNATDFEVADTIILNANYLYYSQSTLTQKILTMDQLKTHHWYPKLLLAALYIQRENVGQGIKIMHELYQELGSIQGQSSYSPIVATVIHPVCEKMLDQKCLNISSRFSVKIRKPYF